MKPKAIVLSPGPCTPNEAGICLDLIDAAPGPTIPMLGVCLGHQAIGQAYGGKVDPRAGADARQALDHPTQRPRASSPACPSKIEVTRYHSLIVERASLPADLEITAETDDGIIMGLQHKTQPVHGVQFHPESIASEHGHDAAGQFPRRSRVRDEAEKRRDCPARITGERLSRDRLPHQRLGPSLPGRLITGPHAMPAQTLKVLIQKVPPAQHSRRTRCARRCDVMTDGHASRPRWAPS